MRDAGPARGGRCECLKEEPELLREAPHHRPVGRLDEVKAAKRAIVRYGFEDHPDLTDEPVEAEPRQLEAQKGA